MKLVTEKFFRATQLTLEVRAANADAAATKLPDGVCARMTGIALVYNVADDYDTKFAPGCLAKTRAEKVNMGKVRLFADHGPFTETHVGIVRSLEDVGDAAVMVADLFDTDAGRAMKEYLVAVLASGAETGLSIGFRPRASEWVKDQESGDLYLVFTEIELREISVTPVNAVPGADVVGIRRGAGESDTDLLKRALLNILRSLDKRDAEAVFTQAYATSAAPADTSSAQPTAATTDAAREAESAEHDDDAAAGDDDTDELLATDDERMIALRKTYAR